MARPKKKGLDYFPLDIDFFSDTKIKLLKSRYGADGITIYVYLLCEIYKNGYYLKADEDFQYIMSDDLNMSIDKVKQVLKFLLERSLFDSKLFQSDTILTSAGIQRRFQLAIRERAKKNPIKIDGFWLLNESETEPFIKVTHLAGKSKNNPCFSWKNDDNSEEKSQKKRKVKNNNNIYFSNQELEKAFLLYIGMRRAGKDGFSEQQIEVLKDELISIGKDDQERIAIAKKAFASGWKSFYPLRKKKQNQPTTPTKKNQFHNFEQREYNYQDLERQFIQKVNGLDKE